MPSLPLLVLGAGGAEIAVRLAASAAHPRRDFSGLVWRGRPYPEALSARILDPFLARWACAPGDRRAQLRLSVDEAMDLCVAAFRECSPERTRDEGRSVMAALTVTANLQRALTFFGETLARAQPPDGRRAAVVLSRRWCGLALKPKKPLPGASADFRPLVRALGCAPDEIDARCREALTALRADLRSGAWLAREDLSRY